MKLTKREQLILTGAVRGLATYRDAAPPAHHGTPTLAERQLDDAIYNAKRRVVDCRPAKWLGRERLLPSDRVANSRAYASPPPRKSLTFVRRPLRLPTSAAFPRSAGS